MRKNYSRLEFASSVIIAISLVSMSASSTTCAAPKKALARSLSVNSKLGDSGALIEPSRRMRFRDSPWDYEIRIALPPSYNQTKNSYPVLWVIDGSYNFEAAVDQVTTSAKDHVPDMIVVSVGTPPEARNEFMRRRAYDFSSTRNNDICSYQEPGGHLYEKQCKLVLDWSKAAGEPSVDLLGGAPKFLNFIIDDVRKQLASDYRMENDNTLFGFSAGGYFCTYALLTRPDGFDRYICGSPNLNIDAGIAFQLEEAYAKSHTDMKAKVFFSAGEDEITQGGVVSAAGLVSWMARMAEILKVRNYPSLELHARVFPGEIHDGSGARISLYWGLRTLWSNQYPSETARQR